MGKLPSGIDVCLPKGKLSSMDFKTFYLGLSVAKRESFAAKANTSRGYCNQVAYAGKEVELGMADVFVALSNGDMTLDDMPLTKRALTQRLIREGAVEKDAAAPYELIDTEGAPAVPSEPATEAEASNVV